MDLAHLSTKGYIWCGHYRIRDDQNQGQFGSVWNQTTEPGCEFGPNTETEH